MAPDTKVASTSDLPLTNGKKRKSESIGFKKRKSKSIGFKKRSDRPEDSGSEYDIYSSHDELSNLRTTAQGLGAAGRILPGYSKATTPEDNLNAQSRQGMPQSPANFQKRITSPDYPRRTPSPGYPRRISSPGYPRRILSPDYPRRIPSPDYPRRIPSPDYPRRFRSPDYPRRFRSSDYSYRFRSPNYSRRSRSPDYPYRFRSPNYSRRFRSPDYPYRFRSPNYPRRFRSPDYSYRTLSLNYLRRSRSPDYSYRTPSPNYPRRSRSPDYSYRFRSPDYPRRSRSLDYPRRSRSPDYPRRTPSPDYPRRTPSPDYPRRFRSPDYPHRFRSPDYPRRTPSPDYPRRTSSPDYPRRTPSPDYPRRTPSPDYPRRSRSPDYLRRSRSLDYPRRSRSPDYLRRSRSLDYSRQSRSLDYPRRSRSSNYPRRTLSPLRPTPFYLHKQSETQLKEESEALNVEEETMAKDRASSLHLSAKERQSNQSNLPALIAAPLSPAPRYGYPWGEAEEQFANDRPAATLDPFKSMSSVSEQLNFPSHRHPGINSEIELHQVYVAKADIPYQHLDYLGRGTFGWVDKVLHTKSSDRMCYARKIIEASNWNASQELEIIRNEVSIIKRLRHEHMAKLVSTYQFEKQFCIIMLPVAECHLGDFLFNLEKTENDVDREKSLQNIWRWYGCLAGAIKYLHEKKVRHKDIKPANILVKEGNIYITDFGIAKDLVDGDTTASIGTQGARSPMYCAPEVYFDGHRRGRKADIFSLGCVFLEMTTVLSGASLQNFHSFRRQGDKSAYAVNLNKVLQWMAYLDVRSNIDAHSKKASYARYWAFIMLDPDADFRPSSQELVQGIQNKHYDFGGTGCGSCNSLVPNTRLRSTSPAELVDLANVGTGEDVLNSSFEVTWEQARTKCLPCEKWVGESLAEPSPLPSPLPSPAVDFV